MLNLIELTLRTIYYISTKLFAQLTYIDRRNYAIIDAIKVIVISLIVSYFEDVLFDNLRYAQTFYIVVRNKIDKNLVNRQSKDFNNLKYCSIIK